MKIIAVGAHLDDIELSCGGMLAKAAKRHSVEMLVVTHSAYKDFNGKALRTKSEAAKEGMHAAKKLGVNKLEVLGFPTKKLLYNDKLVEAIEKYLCKSKADLILTHWIYDTHQDHRNVALATISGARKQNNILMYEPFPPSGRSYEGFRSQVYFDISDTINQKIVAIKEHKSQLKKYGTDWVEAVEGRARWHGFECGCKYAEVFEVVRMSLNSLKIL